MTTQTDKEREDEMRGVAWEVIGGFSIAVLLDDCVEALLEAYKIDDDLYQRDKEAIASDVTDDYAAPFKSYVDSIPVKQQVTNDSTTTE